MTEKNFLSAKSVVSYQSHDNLSEKADKKEDINKNLDCFFLSFLRCKTEDRRSWL